MNSVLPAQPQAYRLLDAWRGVAALMVVWYHASQIIGALSPALLRSPLYSWGAHGNLGVQIFFVVSGYCIANAACNGIARGRSTREFLKARLRRIYPPMWCSLVFYALASLWASHLVKSGRLASSVLAQQDLLHRPPLFFAANLSLTQMPLHQNFLSIVCWTLCYEVAFYAIATFALLAAAVWLNRRTVSAPPLDAILVGQRLFLNLLHGLTLLTLIGLTALPRAVRYPFDLWPVFGLGVLVYDLLANPQERRSKVWLLMIVAGASTALVRLQGGIGWMPQNGRLVFGLAMGFTALLLLLRPHDARLSCTLPARVLAWVGRFSYSLYLTHYLTLGPLTQIVRRLDPSLRFHPLALLMMVAGSVAMARLFFQWFERPFMNHLPPTARRTSSQTVGLVEATTPEAA